MNKSYKCCEHTNFWVLRGLCKFVLVHSDTVKQNLDSHTEQQTDTLKDRHRKPNTLKDRHTENPIHTLKDRHRKPNTLKDRHTENPIH